ncbi:serpin B [Clonorchis sinensis]|nr:serpin B [Clonorchis sinensis]
MAGANDTTLQEMWHTLHVPDALRSNESHVTIGQYLLKQLASSSDVELFLANRLFTLNNVNILADFKHTLSKDYCSDVENIADLETVEDKRRRINQWVAQVTRSKIPELIASGGLAADVVLTIVNALYFRGMWEKPFSEEATSQSKFYCLDGTTIDVLMMFSHQSYPLAEIIDLDAKAIKLPFNGERWKMLILLPNQYDGLQTLLSGLQQPGKFASVLAESFVEEKAKVYLPRFKLADCPPLDVKKLLQNCGIRRLFDREADLSKICADEKLFIGDVMHKAVLEVDEEGATAAAATGIFAVPMCFMPTPVIQVDHPFFLAILGESDVPAFIGHVLRPEVD